MSDEKGSWNSIEASEKAAVLLRQTLDRWGGMNGHRGWKDGLERFMDIS